MCTLTWVREPAGYELFFNRDELKTRQPALPPRELETDGVRWLAAIDADAGGTWLGVNEHGVSVGLLNGWRGGDPSARGATSRGRLVTALLGVAGPEEAERRLRARPLGEFLPFRLIVLAPSGAPLGAAWDGQRLELEQLADEHQPISSSSLDPLGAARSRRETWSRLAGPGRLPGGDELAAFHASHEPEPGAWSPCMHRPDAETVSFTRISVRPDQVALSYRAGSPCGGAPFATLSLRRASAGTRA